MADRGRHAKKIDNVHWTIISVSAFAQSAGVVGVNAVAAQHLPETLLRTRGEVAVTMDGAVAPGVAVAVACGLILVPEGTGTTVLWSPFTDGDAPWFWWDCLHLLYDEAVTDVVGSQMTLCARRVVDSKAMRRIRNTEVQFVVENSTLGVGVSTNTTLTARLLAGS